MGGRRPGQLTITTEGLPGASIGTPFQSPPLEAANAQGETVWDLVSGALPGGLTLEATGVILGTPRAEGVFPFTVRVTDAVATDTLATALPGSGKRTGSQIAEKAGAAGIPDGGVVVCHCRAHTARAPAAGSAVGK